MRRQCAAEGVVALTGDAPGRARLMTAPASYAELWATPPRVVIRLDFDGRGRVGHGKIALLEGIAQTGSIARAARALRMSYPRALALLSQIDETLGAPAATRSAGGAFGGGAALTRSGTDLVARYREIEATAQAQAAIV